MTAIKLVNESALGIYVFAWTSPATGYRCGISWYEGAGDPVIEWTRPSGQHIHRTIADPERFGWADPSGKPSKQQLRVVRDFAHAYAEAAEDAARENDRLEKRRREEDAELCRRNLAADQQEWVNGP